MAERKGHELLRGSLDLMVLSVLADGAKYGYLIQKRIGDASDGGVRLQAGTLYPLLHRLEADGLIKAKWEPGTGRRRCWYELTRKGLQRLGRQADQWQQIARCMDRLIESASAALKEVRHAPGGA